MRNAFLTLTVCFVISAIVGPAWASTVWFPTESGEIDVNYLNSDTFDVALFDDDDNTFSNPLYLNKPGDTISFSQYGGSWELRSTETNNTLMLANSFHFILALDAGGTWLGDSGFDKIAFGIYNVKWGVDEQITMIDAQPVPLQSSILMLGAGLLGLIALRRRE